MYDKELVQEILKQLLIATDKVLYRFEPVNTVSFFTDSPEGMEKLDSICMLLIAIGESLKNLDKITNKTLLAAYPEINWKGAKSMRDIISHQYFTIDAEIIFNVCENNIQKLVSLRQACVMNFFSRGELISEEGTPRLSL